MQALIIDFSRVLVFPYQDDVDSLNRHHAELSSQSDYVFFDHFYLNQELLAYLEKLRVRVPIFIFTDGALHELPSVARLLSGIFKQTFTVESLGLNKKDATAYQSLVAKLGYSVSEVVFVDDKAANVAAATKAGVHAVQYLSNHQLINELDKIFSTK